MYNKIIFGFNNAYHIFFSFVDHFINPQCTNVCLYKNLFTLKYMADFQPNTIYGYPGGELIGTRNIMMQVED